MSQRLANVDKELRMVKAVRGALIAESPAIERLTIPQERRLLARLADLFGVDDDVEREHAAIVQSRDLS
jgi:hypothetical protein